MSNIFNSSLPCRYVILGDGTNISPNIIEKECPFPSFSSLPPPPQFHTVLAEILVQSADSHASFPAILVFLRRIPQICILTHALVILMPVAWGPGFKLWDWEVLVYLCGGICGRDSGNYNEMPIISIITTNLLYEGAKPMM